MAVDVRHKKNFRISQGIIVFFLSNCLFAFTFTPHVHPPTVLSMNVERFKYRRCCCYCCCCYRVSIAVEEHRFNVCLGTQPTLRRRRRINCFPRRIRPVGGGGQDVVRVWRSFVRRPQDLKPSPLAAILLSLVHFLLPLKWFFDTFATLSRLRMPKKIHYKP